MKFIWVVGINSCEINNVRTVCATEEIAKRELFKLRDEMLKSFDYQIETMPTIDLKLFYQKQKAILLNDDPQKWRDNNPCDYPYLSQERLRKEEEEEEEEEENL